MDSGSGLNGHEALCSGPGAGWHSRDKLRFLGEAGLRTLLPGKALEMTPCCPASDSRVTLDRSLNLSEFISSVIWE